MPIELSPHNPRIEAVRELRTVRGRQASNRFAAEGPTLLEEAARSGLRPAEIYATPAGLAQFDARNHERAGAAVYLVPERAFARLSDLESPSGILAVYALPHRTLTEILAGSGAVLLLAGVNDPGNAGTLIRSAEAFGATGVIFGRGGADPYAPKVVRASMGSIFRLPVTQANADDVLAGAEASGRPVVIADGDGEDIRTAGLPPRAILAIGNERRGVRDWLPRWDLAVRIPTVGITESLNAAVAGSIVLYESGRVK